MLDNFSTRYLVSLFTEKTRVTIKQLEMTTQGRRTASVLFNIEKNRLYPLYTLFPKWTIRDWQFWEETVKRKNWIKLEEEHLVLTRQGMDLKSGFLEEYPYLEPINSLEYAQTRRDVWSSFLFITQIISEYRYNNSRYYPYLTSYNDQQQIKAWLKKQGMSWERLSEQWIKDSYAFFNTLTKEHADMLVKQMVGYDQPGMTVRQLSEELKVSETQFGIIENHLIERLRLFSEKESSLFLDLWETVHRGNNFGVSHSTLKTMQMLEQGASIEDVAHVRNLKENTIKDHIIEMVLVKGWKGYKLFIPEDHYKAVNQMHRSNKELSYSEAREIIKDLDFFCFRLIEIERIRAND